MKNNLLYELFYFKSKKNFNFYLNIFECNNIFNLIIEYFNRVLYEFIHLF